MIEILPLGIKLLKKVQKFGLGNKLKKQLNLFSKNSHHPSLNTELLEPKEYCIYSFRIDRKYRVIFIYRDDRKSVEIINITSHYQ